MLHCQQEILINFPSFLTCCLLLLLLLDKALPLVYWVIKFGKGVGNLHSSGKGFKTLHHAVFAWFGLG